jgi:Leucine-rich repeat (LRR) protein
MQRPILLLALFVAILLACSCSKSDSKQATETDSKSASPEKDAKPEEVSEDVRYACRVFEAPWGDSDWLVWSQNNREQAAKWLTAIPQKMPMIDLDLLPSCTHLSSVFLGFSAIVDLTSAATLPNLKTLDLRNAIKLADLTPLKSALMLEQLILLGSNVSELSALSPLPELARIDARRTQVSDLSPLANLPKLEWVDLTQTQVTDITPLAGIEGLKEIRLRDTRVSDLTPLFKVGSRYTYLDLCNTPMSDFSGLSHFPNLQTAYLCGLKIGDLVVLSGLRYLETLDLTNSAVSSLEPLEKLPNLKELILIGVNVEKPQLDALMAAKPQLKIVLNY